MIAFCLWVVATVAESVACLLAFSTKRLHYILYLFGPWILFGLFLKDFFILFYFLTFLLLQNIWDEACYGIQIMKWLFITTFIINFSLCFLTHTLLFFSYKIQFIFTIFCLIYEKIETMEEIKDLSLVMLVQVREENPNLERK